MEQLDDILQAATAAVGEPYFLLPIAGGDPVSRERVYCYELYHQLRNRWPDDAELVLNGEVDKRAHLGMRALGVTNQKPDFLIHSPGDMHRNHAIIEVKVSKTTAKEIRKDLKTLSVFLGGPQYDRGVYLIYGDRANDRFVHRVRAAAQGIEGTAGIEIWLHPIYGAPAMRAAVLD